MNPTTPNPAFAGPTSTVRAASSGAGVAGVDIALLLEGSQPFAPAGIPGWAERMIRALPQTTFAVVVLIDDRRRDCTATANALPDNALPDNVLHLETHFLHDDEPAATARRQRADAPAFAEAARLHELLRQRGHGGNSGYAGAGAAMRELMGLLIGQPLGQPLGQPRDDRGDEGPLSEHAFLHSRQAWDTIVEQYRRYCSDLSFTDYFWTVRTMHRPLWRLARIAATLMPARVYHAASTGYAGFLGAMLRYRHDRPLLVSQHAIHTRQHGIDLFESRWQRENAYRNEGPRRGDAFALDVSQLRYCRDLWLRFFESLGRVCYEAADEIVALYEGNRLGQVQDGAPASRTRTIPNGIDLPALAPLRAQRPARVPPVLCLAGPVMPRKDVKTFIRAMLTVARQCPDAQGWIAGSEDEDPDYARECRGLVQNLGLTGNVHFLGPRRSDELLPQVGVLVLSSISEALPRTVLEAFAAGVPCVVTDVGACRELIEGVGDEDMALGAAGAVVRIADAGALAREAVALLGDGERWRAAQRAAIVRAERYYTEHATVASYRQLYRHLAAKPHADAGARGGVGRPALPATSATMPTPAGERLSSGRCPFAGAP